MTVRFDDLRPGRTRSFEMGHRLGTIVATRPEQVADALSAAEAAVRDGRWVAGWVAYEAAPGLDPSLVTHQPWPDLPLVWFGVFDERRSATPSKRLPFSVGPWEATTDRATYEAAVSEIRRHIVAGDSYQVNHTIRLRAPFSGDAAPFYADLAAAQHGGYAAFVDADRWVVVSASPEAFIEWSDGVLTSRPMKGTAPRGRDLAEDEAARGALLASEKDRAENVMITDMVRNDLGRIARVGSVSVPALFDAERYDTVWQLTSTVVAEPRPGTSLVDVFTASFPAASITGAPKVAAMDIIRRLEDGPRGVYCGAIGFGGPGARGPEWAFNVAIRTVLVDRHAGVAWYGTGGGITHDSDPGGEYDEAVLKTAVLHHSVDDFSLLETMRWDGGFRHLDRHLARLTASAEYFAIPLDPEAVSVALRGAVSGADGPARVRLTVARDGTPTVGVSAVPAPADGLVLAVDTVPIDPTDPFLRHKTTRREVYEAARARHRGADDVVMVNTDGEVTETTIGTIVVKVGGRWWTPPIDAGCLPGVEREALLEAGTVAERRITVAELRNAEAVARVNSLRGWEDAVVADAGT